MRHVVMMCACIGLILAGFATAAAQTYSGTQLCKGCHNSSARPQWGQWQTTLHSKIHLPPDTVSVRPLEGFTNGDSIGMGASYGNAKVYLRRSGNQYFARVTSGGPEYQIAWTYGWGFKQRYLVKIDTSHYVLPIQYNLPGYLNNSGYSNANWVSYSPGTWLNGDGSLKAVNNAFRTKSWDKNCSGCHVTGGKVSKVISGADTSWHASWASNSSSANILVGCESCHGPYQGGAGIGHQMNPANLATKQQKIEVCGQCHNRASSNNGLGTVGTHEFNKNEVADTYFNPWDTTHPLAEFMNFGIAPNTPGGPGTWPDLVTARQHHQQYQEIIGSKHFTTTVMDIVCFTCHAGHGSNLSSHLLRDSLNVEGEMFAVDNDNNTLCLSCHATNGPFTDIQKAWIHDPVTNNDAIGAVVNQHTKHNLYDPTDQFGSGGDGRCTKCHMAKTATSAKPYDIHSHTFAVVPPIRTIQDAGVTISGVRGSINSCATSCHRNPGSGTFIPDFGVGSDPTRTDWGEATDIALAETLWNYWQLWGLTGVREVQHAVPIAYTLSQNYPNPFNPLTKIVVDLPQSGDVRLVVYNLAGQTVATLMDTRYGAGRYEVTWSGHNDEGLAAPSGVYFYELRAGDVRLTKKMLMVR